MISPDEIFGSGFTMIVDDQELQELDQSQINAMFEEMSAVLAKNGLSISIVSSHEDAMKFQGKIYMKQMTEALERLVNQND